MIFSDPVLTFQLVSDPDPVSSFRVYAVKR
jgi:hypothetical protein